MSEPKTTFELWHSSRYGIPPNNECDEAGCRLVYEKECPEATELARLKAQLDAAHDALRRGREACLRGENVTAGEILRAALVGERQP